ncbi:dihydrolipoamide acetyltransferase family protein [Streptomyces sp. NPDC018031]|uniref:dihydrolipoamide acetyltransferase family protein n=1 Tax=Streptomyces sp. NPDC018031 TaxID=3365033 RepID=UPI0037B232B8
MAVVREFALPDLGEGLTEALIVRWLVEVGDVVAIDQLVVEVETAKAMVEVPCPYGGVVTARFGEEGTELPVGSPLLTVAVPASDGEADAAEAPAADAAAAGATAGGAEGSGNVLVGYGTGAPAARRRRIRPSGGLARNGTGTSGPAAGPEVATGPGAVPAGATRTASQPAGGAAAGRPAGHRPRPAGESRGPAPVGSGTPDRNAHGGPIPDGEPVPVISPLVRRLAREHGIDLRGLRGSGPEGLILRADVEHAARQAAEGTPVATGAGTATGTLAGTAAAGSGSTSALAGTGALTSAPGLPAEAQRIPLRGLRGAVADKLTRSRSEIPDATCWVDADATELLAARAAMNAAGGPKVSLLALLARICTAGLARFPELNATVDLAAREIVRLPGVHLGFAAQTDRGLVVPVVRDAHTLNAEQLGAEMARLTEAAREGRLSPAQLTGGTFTLNNYGVFGVDGSTPIINHPEAAMLGVGRIVAKPWVHQGELAIRQVAQLSFTFDHRVCDGGTAGGFLRYVADCVEQPAVLLRTL